MADSNTPHPNVEALTSLLLTHAGTNLVLPSIIRIAVELHAAGVTAPLPPDFRSSGTHVICTDPHMGVAFGKLIVTNGDSEYWLTADDEPDLTMPDAEWVFEQAVDGYVDAGITDWSVWLIRDGEVVKHAAMTNRFEYNHRRFAKRGPAVPVEVQQTPINTRNDPSRPDYLPTAPTANDSCSACARSGVGVCDAH